MTLLYVALGAAIGAPLRYIAGHLWDAGPGTVPWGTLLVNLLGSAGVGLFSGLGLQGAAWPLLGVGLCGALTTFSALAVQAHERGPRLGGAYLAVTVAGALALCAAGFALGARWA